MKEIIKNSFALFLLAGLGSCNPIDYDGTYSPDGYYELHQRGVTQAVYFDRKNVQDSLQLVSFGPLFEDETELKIPVKITGFPTNKNLHYSVKVNEKLSTAKQGKHYKNLPTSFEIAPKSLEGGFDITLLRGDLKEEEDQFVMLVLELQSTNELLAAFPEKKKLYIKIDNYLAPPLYWPFFHQTVLGNYTPTKFRKLLTYYNGSLEEYKQRAESLQADWDYLSVKLKETYDFFKAHPEYNQDLP